MVWNLALVFFPSNSFHNPTFSLWIQLPTDDWHCKRAWKKVNKVRRAKTHVGSHVCARMIPVNKNECVQNMKTNVTNVNRILIFPYFFVVLSPTEQCRCIKLKLHSFFSSLNFCWCCHHCRCRWCWFYCCCCFCCCNISIRHFKQYDSFCCHIEMD